MTGMRKTPRIDNKRIARCGKYSMYHCWKYRYKDPECLACEKYVVKGRKSKIINTPEGRMIKCYICGRLLPISEFYVHRKTRFDAFGNPVKYASYIYRCRECTEDATKRSRKLKTDKGDNKSIDYNTVSFCGSSSFECSSEIKKGD